MRYLMTVNVISNTITKNIYKYYYSGNVVSSLFLEKKEKRKDV